MQLPLVQLMPLSLSRFHSHAQSLILSISLLLPPSLPALSHSATQSPRSVSLSHPISPLCLTQPPSLLFPSARCSHPVFPCNHIASSLHLAVVRFGHGVVDPDFFSGDGATTLAAGSVPEAAIVEVTIPVVAVPIVAAPEVVVQSPLLAANPEESTSLGLCHS
jgi:hypothetical protein